MNVLIVLEFARISSYAKEELAEVEGRATQVVS